MEDQRKFLIENYLTKTASMAELCQECGVSRPTGYKWVERYKEGGLENLSDQSRAPLAPNKKYSKEQIDIALSFKVKYPRYGPKKIRALLKQNFPDQEWPCETRLYEIFKDHHLVCSRKLRRRVPRTHPLGQINESNDIWCADFKGWFLTDDKVKVEPLTITDAYSRFLIKCEHLDKKKSIDVWDVYADAFLEYGLPKRIRTDNGPPFATTGVGRLSKLSINLIKVGILPEWINPGHPEENGRHERFHRSLKDAVANPPAETFSEQVFRMKVYMDEYNFERPHEALNQQVPSSYYEPSNRQWDGILRPPEYNTKEMTVRKVGQSGCIHWKQKHHYLGQVLSGEYVGLKQIENETFDVFYGPIYLGILFEGKGFQRPELIKKR